MAKVLITGGAGFIGLQVARKFLLRGDSVDLLDNFQRGCKDEDLAAVEIMPGARLVTGDLRAAETVAHLQSEYDYIFHFAALLGVQNVLARPYETLVDNVALTAAAIDIARKQKALRRLVFASTSEIYAGTAEKFGIVFPTPEDTPLTLTDPSHPRTSYMLSKLCGEAMCHYAGVPITIVRPHNVYGPRMGMSHVIPQLLERAYRAADGDEFKVYSVHHTRTFCYIDDAVELLVRAADATQAEGMSLNIGSEAPEVRIDYLADVVLQVVGRRLRIVAGNAHPGSPSRRCPDMRRTAEVTGFRAQVGLAEGVGRTFDWYRRQIFDAPDKGRRLGPDAGT